MSSPFNNQPPQPDFYLIVILPSSLTQVEREALTDELNHYQWKPRKQGDANYLYYELYGQSAIVRSFTIGSSFQKALVKLTAQHPQIDQHSYNIVLGDGYPLNYVSKRESHLSEY